MKLWKILTQGICAPILGALVALYAFPVQALTPAQEVENESRATQIAQALGERVLQDLQSCLFETLPNPQQPSLQALQTASIQCFYQTILLAPDGSLRTNANQRLTAVFEALGVTLPQTTSQGQATIPLQLLPDEQVFTLPVDVGGQTGTFLLDTGATNSIISRQVAQQLALAGTPIADELLQYLVVGEDCSNINAALHPLPTFALEAATVQGMTGISIPQASMVGELSGILGLDFLKGFDVVIDPQALQLRLLPPSPLMAGAIPLEGKLGVMATEVLINGQGPFTFLLDTGASVMVVSDTLAEQLALDLTQAEAVEVTGFCGTESALKTRLDRVRLREHQANNLETVVLDSEVLSLLGVDGIVGQNFLNRYRQYWQFGPANALGFPEEGRLRLVPVEGESGI